MSERNSARSAWKKYGFKEMDGHPAPFRMFGNRIKTVSGVRPGVRTTNPASYGGDFVRLLAERERFELSIELPLYTLSRNPGIPSPRQLFSDKNQNKKSLKMQLFCLFCGDFSFWRLCATTHRIHIKDVVVYRVSVQETPMRMWSAPQKLDGHR